LNSPDTKPSVEVVGLRHQYGEHVALRGVDFSVGAGEVFGLLGPNGGGKTTTFRILSTLLRPSGGTARILGHDVVGAPDEVRRRIGVVFQSPSLDNKLKVLENLKNQGHLYGMQGRALLERSREMLAREKTVVESLSGGLKRRVEVAKGLLHSPEVLLLDEPSTGLDPGARKDLWDVLADLASGGVTVLVTTHLMEEAERCDRLCILHRGEVVAIGRPDELRKQIGGDVLLVEAAQPEDLCKKIQERFGGAPMVVDGQVRLEKDEGHRFLTDLIEAFPGDIDGIHIGKPTLEDVFVQRTGHRFHEEANA